MLDSTGAQVSTATGNGSVGYNFAGGLSYDHGTIAMAHTEQYYYFKVKIVLARLGGYFGGGAAWQHTFTTRHSQRAYIPKTIMNQAGFHTMASPYSAVEVGGAGINMLGNLKIDAGADTGTWWGGSTPSTSGGTLLVKRNAAIMSDSIDSDYDLYVGGTANVENTGSLGSIAAVGNIIAYVSDERVKSDVQLIENPVERLKNIGGYTFKWNDKAAVRRRGKKEYGVIAQEVLKEFPETVTQFKHSPSDIKAGALDGKLYSVLYDRLVPVLIESIKEQQNQIDDLKGQLNTIVCGSLDSK